MKKVVVFLADGFEECEGLLVVDLLRRAEVEVITASINSTRTVVSSHNITLLADELAENIDYSSVDMLVLPGGVIGTANLAKNRLVLDQCRLFSVSKKVAAICAAPSILDSLGILSGKCATVHPSFDKKMENAILTPDPVVVSGNITTGRSLAFAIPFALELIRQLCSEDTAKNVAASICFN